MAKYEVTNFGVNGLHCVISSISLTRFFFPQKASIFDLQRPQLTMSCCPPNADKYLAPTYDTTGKQVTLPSGNEVYQSGSVGESKRAILLIPDVYGWNGGRTRNIADMFAEAGYFVVVPKLLAPGLQGGVDGDGKIFHLYLVSTTMLLDTEVVFFVYMQGYLLTLIFPILSTLRPGSLSWAASIGKVTYCITRLA